MVFKSFITTQPRLHAVSGWAPLSLVVLGLLSGQNAAHAGWAEDALKSEADYLVNCSFTTYAKNNQQVQKTDAAYGALNNVRLQDGPDWVQPGEGAMAMIGLMAATQRLHAEKVPVTTYVAVIDAYFNDWLLHGKTALCQDTKSDSYGGITNRVTYNADGSLTQPATQANSGVTGATLSAMWKYYEFNLAMGRDAEAKAWLNGEAFQIALGGGKFIEKCHNATYNMVTPSPSGGDMWINDSSLSVAGLRCLAKWAQTVGKPAGLDAAETTPTQLADALALGLEGMKDNGDWKGFYKFRNPADGSRSYGGSIDQLCFVPYETNALDPAQQFNRSISDFWTDGAAGRRMTYQTSDAKAWTYFGTRWHYYDAANAETDRLTPGAGLQLGKVEWKYAHAHNDATLRQRAMNRFQFVNSPAYSNLWYGEGGRSEVGVAGGIVDWRAASQTDNTGATDTVRAPEWQRFIDTSAYFIEMTLMSFWDEDTKYTPN